ncbi:MAG: hypothetical protein IPH30_04800 [Betaproteobacteria bacterium]|nr:hypothetical protein [Betaproteobacteria bacterium]
MDTNPSARLPQMNLYIVEDSSLVRERLMRTLEDLPGLDIVGTAEDVPAAIDGLTSCPPTR